MRFLYFYLMGDHPMRFALPLLSTPATGVEWVWPTTWVGLLLIARGD